MDYFENREHNKKMDDGMIFVEYMPPKTRHRLVILPGLRVRTVTPALAYTEWCKSHLTLNAPQNGRVERFTPHCLYHYILAQKSRDAPTGLTFNNCMLCPHCIYVFCIYLRTNSELCHLKHKLIGFYNRDEKCLQRGTDWVFK